MTAAIEPRATPASAKLQRELIPGTTTYGSVAASSESPFESTAAVWLCQEGAIPSRALTGRAASRGGMIGTDGRIRGRNLRRGAVVDRAHDRPSATTKPASSAVSRRVVGGMLTL